MSYFSEKILNGLKKVPSYGSPGSMIILNNKSQAVFTGSSSGEVFLAAAEFGNGRIFICAHDMYYYWFEKDGDLSEVCKDFIDNVKKWLVKSDDISSLEIIDVNEVDEGIDVEKNQVVKWCQDADVDESKQKCILEYLSTGGSLLLAVTPWGFLQMNEDKKLTDLPAYMFLKTNFDIILTDLLISVDSEIPVEDNLARFSDFTKALTKVTANANKLSKYCSTLESGISVLKREGFIKADVVTFLEDSIKGEILKRDLYPLKDRFIKDIENKNLLKLYGKCLIEKEWEKAPHIDDFPGDFNELPELLKEITIDICTKFNEWVSTGLYLPAGVEMTVTVNHGCCIEDWMVRIGAHTDDLSCCDGINRWPIISITKPLEDQFNVCSPFGGLVYFQR
jgi:hypothetical protein